MVRKWYQLFCYRYEFKDSRVHADARIQQEPEVASYFEMHVRGCYIVEEYYHVDQQEDGSKQITSDEESQNRNWFL